MAKPRKPIESDDGSVEIDLAKPPQTQPAEDKQPDYSGRRVEAPPVIKTLTEPEAPPLQPEQPEEAEDLSAQVERLKTAERKAKERADAAEQARQQDQLRARQVEQQGRVQTDQARYESVVNALAATQAEADGLQADYSYALQNNDHIKAAEVHRKMVRAENRIQQLEDGKVEFERHFEAMRRAPPPVQTAPDFEQVLAQMPALTNEERGWLREHKDALMDPTQVQRLQIAYLDAQRDGIERGSPQYFRYFEQRLGYESPEPEPTYDEEPPVQPRQETRRVAAPVSRQAPGVTSRRTVETRVTLSPAEREAARIAGADEHSYAANKVKLAEMKKRGYYQETG